MDKEHDPGLPIRVILVDDDAVIRQIATLSLSLDPRLRVVTADSGEHGLEQMAADVPDLVILDMMMPGLDGPGVLERMRAQPALARVPVIFLTAKASPADQARAIASGARGLIPKPFDPMRLAAQAIELWRSA